MAALIQSLFGVGCLLLGIGLNQWIRRSNRIEAYAAAIYKERFDIYVKLWETMRDAKPMADEIINDSTLSAEDRHNGVAALVHQIAGFCDENDLYLNQEVTVHCCTVFMVEDIANEPDAKTREEKIARFERDFRKATDIIRAETGLQRMDGVFRKVTRATYSSDVIEYFRQLKKEQEKNSR